DGVCLGEHRAVGQQISLRGMAAMRRIVSPGHVNSTSRRCDPSPGAVGGHPERMPHLNGRLLYLPIKYWNSHYPFFKWMEIRLHAASVRPRLQGGNGGQCLAFQ